MADLNTDIRYIKGVGEARAKAFEKLGVFTLGDLIAYYPRRWEDRSQLYPIRDLPEGEYACCKAMIAQPRSINSGQCRWVSCSNVTRLCGPPCMSSNNGNGPAPGGVNNQPSIGSSPPCPSGATKRRRSTRACGPASKARK